MARIGRSSLSKRSESVRIFMTKGDLLGFIVVSAISILAS